MVKRKLEVYLGDASGGVVTITEHGEVEVTGVAQSRVAGECSSEAELPAGLPNIQVATDLSEVDGQGGGAVEFFWTLLTQAGYEVW